MDVVVEVKAAHHCNRLGRWVEPGEEIVISRNEARKRLRVTSAGEPLLEIKGVAGPEVQTLGPEENQAFEGPPENKQRDIMEDDSLNEEAEIILEETKDD